MQKNDHKNTLNKEDSTFNTSPDELLKVPDDTPWQKFFWNIVGITFILLLGYGLYLTIKGDSFSVIVWVVIAVLLFIATVYSLSSSGDV